MAKKLNEQQKTRPFGPGFGYAEGGIRTHTG